MKKTKIKLNINDLLIEKDGILNDNMLILNSDNENITYILSDNILIKDSLDNIIKLDFNKNTLNCYLKESKQSFITDIKVKNKLISNNKINIIYEIENNLFNLDIEYEVL